MPDRYAAYLKMGKRDVDHAMPWDKLMLLIHSLDKTAIQ
jgi:carboxyl-terminal processing protease